MPGWDMITRTRARAQELAFSRDEAALFLLAEATKFTGPQAPEGAVPRAETAEGLARTWHTVLEERRKWWTGDSNY